MASAGEGASAQQGQAANVPVEGEEGAIGGENGAAGGQQGESHEGGAAEHMLRVALWRDFHDAAAPAQRRNHIQIRFAVEGNALGPAKAAIEHNYLATLRDAVNAIVTGGGGAGDVEIALSVNCQARRIDEGSDVGFHAIVGGDFVKRDGYALPARAAEGDVD